MHKKTLVVSLAAVLAAPLQTHAQRAVAYEGGIFAHFTKFDNVTTLDNALGLGIDLDAYILKRLALEYSGDVAPEVHSSLFNDKVTPINHRFDLVYNIPLNNKWRWMLGGGWTGSRYNGDVNSNQYDSGLNALTGVRYCMNDDWNWKAGVVADFKDPSDQAPSFSRSTTWSIRVGLSHFFGGQAKNGPCVNGTSEPLPPPPPPARQAAPAPQQQAAPTPAPAQPQPQPQQQRPQPAPAPAPTPAPPPAPKLRTFAPVYFAYDQSTLSKAAKDTLDGVIAFMKSNANAKVQVTGHTDNKGSDEYNSKLGARRATVVKNYLVSKGIAAARITAVTKSFSEPAESNDTEAGRAKNRRAVAVEIQP